MCEVCAFCHFLGFRYLEACPVESDLSCCVGHMSAIRSLSIKYIPDCTANTSQSPCEQYQQMHLIPFLMVLLIYMIRAAFLPIIRSS